MSAKLSLVEKREFEIQYWSAGAPASESELTGDADCNAWSFPERRVNVNCLVDTENSADYLVWVVGYQIACTGQNAIDQVMARLGAKSELEFLKNMSQNPDDSAFLVAEEDVAKFQGNYGEPDLDCGSDEQC